MTRTEVVRTLREAAKLVSHAVAHLNTEQDTCDCGHVTPRNREEFLVAKHLNGTVAKLFNQANRLSAANAAGDTHDDDDDDDQ